MFSQPKMRRYTWTMSGAKANNQIDYTLVRNKYKNQVIKCKNYPGADIYSGHNLILMKMNLSLKKDKNRNIKRKWCIDKLKNKRLRDFNKEVKKLQQETETDKHG